jgi:hypothetical protein
VLTGFSSVPANSPALVQNSGVEITAGASLVKTNDFNWSINFNTAINRNKLVAYPNFLQSPYVGIYQIGQPLNIRYALHYTGVDPQTGQYQFSDKNHDGVITYNPGQPGDDSYIVNFTPKFFGGLGMNFNYKSFQLSLFFNIQVQVGKNAFEGGYLRPGLLNQNAPVLIIGKEWKRPGDIVSIGKFSTRGDADQGMFDVNSDGGLTDASFIRLSNLSLSYSLPANYSKKIGLVGSSFFFHVNNLLILTKYKGIDPETQNFGGLPPVKVLVGGISFNF